MAPRRLFIMFSIVAILALVMQGGSNRIGQAAAPEYIQGTFISLWGDGAPGSPETHTVYFLATDQGETFQLLLDEGLLASRGGVTALNRQRVNVYGTWLEEGVSFQVQSMTLADAATGGPEGVYGPQPWVSILCKFADIPDEPNDLNFFQAMYSANYPGLDHFWRQNSYDLANLLGSNAFGWYTLPHERSYYVPPSGYMNWWAAAEDCTAAADPYVDFSPYVGINLMFNANLDCCAWGGSWYACLDGECKDWRMTWEPPWGYHNIGVIAHETGHGFGLPHSLGNCQQGYDNRWDVLSDIWSNGTDPLFPQFGTMGQHTISYHKGMLGWFTPQQVYTATTGSLNTITLERLALPQTGNYLGARILVNNLTDTFYTLEVRQPTSNPIDYDKWLPGFAVIIHDIQTSRPEPAIVIDRDGNCDTGDAGAMYTVGEVFRDLPNGISVSIDALTSTGYVVTVNNRFTLMQGVDISGVEQAYPSQTVPITTTITPPDATTPITYTWEATGMSPFIHVGGTVDSAEFAWEDIGTKAITVTASNRGGEVSATHLVEIVPKVPIVSLSAPALSQVGEMTIFTATVEPSDVALPVTYTWQATGQLPVTHTAGISDTVAFVWDSPGTQAITVTASNLVGSTTDSYNIPVLMAPSLLDVVGAAVGNVNDTYIFTATVSPITASVPLTFTWIVDGEVIAVHATGTTDLLALSWDQPGPHEIFVTAANPVGSVEGSWMIMIYTRVFIPMGLRH